MPSGHQLQDEVLVEQIQQIYEDNWQAYGSPRIHRELRETGLRCSRKRVARLMRKPGISVKPKRRRVRTTDSQHSDPVTPNLLSQQFTADEPDQKWLTDITAMRDTRRLALSGCHPGCLLPPCGGPFCE